MVYGRQTGAPVAAHCRSRTAGWTRGLAAKAAILMFVAASALAQSVGPIDPANGFPLFYADGQGTAVCPCLSNPAMCGLLNFVLDPIPGLAFPLNYGGTFPTEATYFAAQAEMPTDNGGKATLALAITGSFSTGFVLPGDQMGSARIRVRADNLVAGATYRVTHPYGTLDLISAGGRRSINQTLDYGLLAGDFTAPLASPLFPFLRWDSPLLPTDDAARRYLGDPNVAHTVTGSPTGNNLFRIEGPSVGGPGIDSIETDLFFVAGQVHVPPPQAGFSASVLSGRAPLPVSFLNSSTGEVGSWRWEFGDGSQSSARQPSKIFTVPGVYTVSLTATGPGGQHTERKLNYIRVRDPLPRIVLMRNDGAGGRVRVRTSMVGPDRKLILCSSLAMGTDLHRHGRLRFRTGLQRPEALAARAADLPPSTVDLEFVAPLGWAGTVRYLQVLDPTTGLVSNVIPITF